MNNFTTAQMLELAVIYCSDQRWKVLNDKIVGQYGEVFSPSISPDAQDWQLAQACRVIVAAMGMGVDCILGRYGKKWNIIIFHEATFDEYQGSPDILQAACRALLVGDGK